MLTIFGIALKFSIGHKKNLTFENKPGR